MWRPFSGKRTHTRQRTLTHGAGTRNRHRPKFESLEERTVPSILFSNTGSRTIIDSGGPVLNHMQVDLIFWGHHWSDIGNQALRFAVTNTANAILNSTYFDGLSQYRSIGHGSLLRTDTIGTTDPPANFTTGYGGDVANFVTNNINNGTLPSPNGQILYFVVPQPGSVTSDCGCGGRHLAGIASGNRAFPYGLVSNPTGVSIDTLSVIISHEMVEAATNPEWNLVDGQGNTLAAFHVPGANGDEIGDGEAQGDATNNFTPYVYRVNGALVQAFLSMRDRSYIVTNGSTNNFLVSSAFDLSFRESSGGGNLIEVYRANNGVAASLNFSTAQFEPGYIKHVTVNALSGDSILIDQTGADAPVNVRLGSGPEGVSIGNNLGAIQGQVNVVGSGTGNGNVVISDSSAPDNLDLTYSVTYSSVTRPGAALITYSGLANGSVTLVGSNGQDVYNVTSTSSLATTAIRGGSRGYNQFYVKGTTGPLTINGNNTAGQVYVGDNNLLANIYGAVSLTGFRTAGASLHVLNSADTGSNRTVTLRVCSESLKRLVLGDVL